MEAVSFLVAILVLVLAGLIAVAIFLLAFRGWYRAYDWLIKLGVIRHSRKKFKHQLVDGICINCGMGDIYERCNDNGHRLKNGFCVNCGVHGSVLRKKLRKCAGKTLGAETVRRTAGSPLGAGSLDFKPSPPLNVMDHRSDLERSVEQDAHRNLSRGPEADNLIERLVAIGKTERFIASEKTPSYNERLRQIAAREIGARLFELGGHDLMLFAWYRVGAVLGPTVKGDLEYAWDGVGDWVA
jgi:hypothetical protein